MPFAAALSWCLLLASSSSERESLCHIPRRLAQIAFCRRSSRPNNRWYYLFRKFSHLYLGQLNLDRDRYPWAADQTNKWRAEVVCTYSRYDVIVWQCSWWLTASGRSHASLVVLPGSAPKDLSPSSQLLGTEHNPAISHYWRNWILDSLLISTNRLPLGVLRLCKQGSMQCNTRAAALLWTTSAGSKYTFAILMIQYNKCNTGGFNVTVGTAP